MNIFRNMDRRTFWTLYLLFLAVLVWLCVDIIKAADARILERLGH